MSAEKISIIMPSYNDKLTIKYAIESVIEQTYTNWELIIVDDGSTDNMKDSILEYMCEKIKYVYQENKDQLNAIINGLNYISGEFICILHSDDMLNDKASLQKCINYMNKYKDIDAIIGDLNIVDSENKVINRQEVLEYKKTKSILPLQLLWLGRNLYVDVAFYRKKPYVNIVKSNYLEWNTPFWIDFNLENIHILNVKKVDFIFYKYRVYKENYINNEIGKLNVISGELRTAIHLMNYYSIPFYIVQYYIYRIFNKLKLKYIPIYFKKKQKKTYKIIRFIIKKRFNNKFDNIYLKSIMSFYKNYKSRTINIDFIIKEELVYKGKDIKKFNRKLIDNELSELYTKLFSEMQLGFDSIRVLRKEDEKLMLEICKFLCISQVVKIHSIGLEKN